jgi:hypothetical protein
VETEAELMRTAEVKAAAVEIVEMEVEAELKVEGVEAEVDVKAGRETEELGSEM